jgi:hypothetical protein
MELIVLGGVINLLPGIVALLRKHNSVVAIWITLILLDILSFIGIFTAGIGTLVAAIMWFTCLIWCLTGNTKNRDDGRARMIAVQIKREFEDR